MTDSTYTPAREVSVALVSLFTTNPQWSAASTVGASGGLLFPSWSPRTHQDDYRVWSNRAEMPSDPLILNALPRLLFDVNWRPHTYEQEEPGRLHGSVSVWLHILTPREQEEYGERMLAAAMLLIASTRLSSARIIAAELTATSDATKDRIAAFNGAWEWMVNLRSPNVGVLA